MFYCKFMFLDVQEKVSSYVGNSSSALLITLIYPYPLRDTGFQLSYAGALGAFAGWRIRPGSQTARFLGAIAGVFPFMCLHFNDVSVAGLVLGSIWTSLGTVLIICGWLCVVHPWLAWLFGWFPFLLARGILDFGAIISRIPFASMAFPAPTATEIFTYVLLYLVILSVFGCRGGINYLNIVWF